MKLLTRLFFIFLLLPVAVYAEPNSSFSGKNITFNATEGVEMCSGTDSIKLAVGCTGGGTTHVLELDTAGDLALPGGLALGDSISLVNGATTASLTVTGGLLSLDSTGVTQFKRNGTAYAQLSTGAFHPATNAGSTLGSSVYGWGTLYLGAATGKIVQNTIDGSDNRATCLAGGSDCAYANGGYIFTYGNESGSKGDVLISGGDAAGSDVTIRAFATGSTISFITQNTASQTMEANGDFTMEVAGASIVMRSPDGSFSECSVDNSDNFTCTGI